MGGPNGSGKTTVFPILLPNFYWENVLNMSMQMRSRPEDPNSIQSHLYILAAGLMIQRLRTLSYSGTDSAFETTLADRNLARFLRNCKTKGYTMNLVYFWLQSPEIPLERVRPRVESGRHSLPEIDLISLILLLR
ncbi:hypothetical protein NDI43_20270 [Microcoleus vaginatus GB2-A3]